MSELYYIEIAQFQGIGYISKSIRWQTDSIWSHTAAVLRDGSVVESWHKGGVSHVDGGHTNFYTNRLYGLSKNHNAGTKVDLFYIPCTKEQYDGFEAFLLSHIGDKYDFWAVLRFVTRKPYDENDRWFCSEYIAEALCGVNIPLQCRIRTYKMSPQLVGISVVPQFIDQVVTI